MTHDVWTAMDDRKMEFGGGAPVESETQYRHWKRCRDDNDVEWIILDKAGSRVNVLSAEVLTEMLNLLEEAADARPRGLVLRSGKPKGFTVGADVSEFKDMTSLAEVENKVRRAHAVADMLDKFPAVTAVVIHGLCLGGGLELSLCCDHRIALPDARLGFPEVKLGLHPGLGGTFRSVRLIDPADAMTMMLTGKNKTARQALKSGLVDAVVEERHVAAAVRAALSEKLKNKRRGLKGAAMNTGPMRRMAAKKMRTKTREKANPDHYPAPRALIDLWEAHGGNPKAMQKAEIASFSRLLIGDTAQNLVRLFFLRDKMKGMGDAVHPVHPVHSVHHVHHVHIIGAGAMGGDIAAWCAYKGFQTTLFDVDLDALGRAVARAASLFDKKCDTGAEARDALDRLIPDPAGDGVPRADLVIEAVPENHDLKIKIYGETEPRMKDGAILATNTSGIRLETLREHLRRPERFVGLHFFNPVAKMHLVEVVDHDRASDGTLAVARSFVVAIDRLPAPVRSAPGFLVNRALMPYLLEALLMMDEGIAPETIDRAAEDFGMPMGPITLADKVGLDICVDVAGVLRNSLDEPVPGIPDWVARKVEDGHLGEKSEKGLYDYEDGKPKKNPEAPDPDPETADRLLLPMVNACVRLLREGVTDDEEIVDGAMVFGTGFAPFRGGPIRYAQKRGIADIRETLSRLADRHGDRFRPDEGWDRL
jgi:3-hydroxyacyl-CoA dehydrogenase / enoyl-CoA hydratase / 3-hydroxybutyryl-CoA epimerase